MRTSKINKEATRQFIASGTAADGTLPELKHAYTGLVCMEDGVDTTATNEPRFGRAKAKLTSATGDAINGILCEVYESKSKKTNVVLLTRGQAWVQADSSVTPAAGDVGDGILPIAINSGKTNAGQVTKSTAALSVGEIVDFDATNKMYLVDINLP